jgi:hypothetical protein
MKKNIVKPTYLSDSRTKNPDRIQKIESLCRKLSIHENQLKSIIKNKAKYISITQEPKSDGTYRTFYSANEKLAYLQDKIHYEILRKVVFPEYVQGSVKDLIVQRDFIADAKLHIGCKVLISIDIKNFFPSIQVSSIQDIWRLFFKFSPEVSEILTELTTMDGALQQGFSTSPSLANLLFWDIEHILHGKLEKRGFLYSRYVDDCSISSKSVREKEGIEWVIKQVFGMFIEKGVDPHRKPEKLRVMTLADPKGVIVHGIRVLKDRVSLTRQKKSEIRNNVHLLEKKWNKESHLDAYAMEWEKVKGKVAFMNSIHPNQTKKYLVRLKKIKPQIRPTLAIRLQSSIEDCAVAFKNPSISLNEYSQIHHNTDHLLLKYQSKYSEQVRSYRRKFKDVHPRNRNPLITTPAGT